MTAISLFLYRNVPMMFGDTLISRPKETSGIFSLPTAGVSGFESDNYQPAGLCQKIIKISENVLFMWAGRLIEARDFQQRLSDLDINFEQYVSENDTTLIQSFMDDFSYTDLSVIVLLRLNSDTFAISSKNCNTFQIEPFEQVISSGSGEGLLFAELCDLASRLPPHLAIEGMDKKNSDIAVFFGLMESILQSRFLFQTMAHVDTGGIVECAIAFHDRIEKPISTTFIFWDEELNFPFNIFPFLLIKRFYENGIMYVAYCNFLNGIHKRYCIGDPKNISPILPDDCSKFNPLHRDMKNVHTIRFTKEGICRHRQENVNIILSCFRYNELFRTVIFNEWYAKDIETTKIESNRHVYPYD